MFGTLFNVAMIIAGSAVGSVFRRGIKEEYQTILMQTIGLAAVAVGIHAIVKHMPDSRYPVLFIVSLALGGLIGQRLDLDGRFNALVRKFSKSNLSEGLSTAILLFCIGSLSILGPVQAALQGDHTYLLANGTLDGITSIILASTYGIGIAASALVLLAWQGSIYLFALTMQSSINLDLLNEVTIVGGILILASGLSVLGIKKFQTMNLLPALFIPPLALLVLQLFGL